jgi:transcriptional regulator with XRE-family HTH domain
MSLIDRIDMRLEALGISAREASKRVQLGQSYIRDLHRNPQQSPRLEDLTQLAKALETNVVWLITGDGDPNQVPDEPTAEVVSLMPSLDAKRRAEAATFVRFLAEQKKRETGE